MAYLLRTRRCAYDNISVGNATGRENTAIGSAGSTEVYAGGSRIIKVDGATSAPQVSTEPTSDNARSRIITTAGGVTSLDPQEYPENQN